MIAIIPARGGSKSIQSKNLQIVGGMTLVERAIKLCKRVADEVIVTSDDNTILRIAKDQEVIAWPRDPSIAQDESPTIAALRDVVVSLLAGYEQTGSILYHQCTAPLTQASDLKRCIAGLPGHDMSCLVHRFHGFLIDSKGYCINAQLSPRVPRRQDMKPQYQIAGSAWCFDASYLARPFYSGNIAWVEVEGKTLDIDDPLDLHWAQRICEEQPNYVPDMSGV